jgi:hypothetical protein
MSIVTPKMEGLEHVAKIREYCDYLEEHIKNVQQAWLELQDKCKHMRFIYDDYVFWNINGMIDSHDLSKFSTEEFIQYQQNFFSVGGEVTDRDRGLFDSAWEHHKANNPHHWENWTSKKYGIGFEDEMNCVCMVADWMAMGKKFGDTARDYYEKNKGKIKLPEWADKFVNEIFDCVYGANTAATVEKG